VEINERLKKLKHLLEQLQDSWVLTEGLRDKEALRRLGITKVLTISGNLRQSCERLSARDVDKAYVLSDLDRRGDELAKSARDELEARSIKADLEMRRKLAHLLRIRNFEDAARAYEKLKEEGEIYG
jgi:5S rRNA maturation endonuclease (ribonuclease M5)